MDNDYAFIHETNIFVDRMFYTRFHSKECEWSANEIYIVYGVHIFRTLNTNADKCVLVFCVLLPNRKQNQTRI